MAELDDVIGKSHKKDLGKKNKKELIDEVIELEKALALQNVDLISKEEQIQQLKRYII